MIGHIKWFNVEKGYGFITHIDGETFVHYTELNADKRSILPDDRVEFEIIRTSKGEKAIDVRLI